MIPKRSIVFKPGWSAAPRGFTSISRFSKDGKLASIRRGVFSRLKSLDATRLLLELANLCKYKGSVILSNRDAMTIMGAENRMALNRARSTLIDLGVLETEPTDASRTAFEYRVRPFVELGDDVQEDDDPSIEGIEFWLEPIPHQTLTSKTLRESGEDRRGRQNSSEV
ncbi:MAG TPA: hypothetical protein VGF96_05910 [Terracidiphilus sp.]|jgi:hypothetical protein